MLDSVSKYTNNFKEFKAWFIAQTAPVIYHYLTDGTLHTTYYTCCYTQKTPYSECINHYDADGKLIKVSCAPEHKLVITESSPRIVVWGYHKVTIKNCRIKKAVFEKVASVKCVDVGLHEIIDQCCIRKIDCRNNQLTRLRLSRAKRVDCRENPLRIISIPCAQYIRFSQEYNDAKPSYVHGSRKCEYRNDADERVKSVGIHTDYVILLGMSAALMIIAGMLIFVFSTIYLRVK